MNPVESALNKQRLQLEITAQRQALDQHLEGLAPALVAADRIHAALYWLRRHPEVIAGSVAVLVAARPSTLRLFWRWGRRGFIAWRLWRDSDRWLKKNPVRINS